jgi:hypothetical protein
MSEIKFGSSPKASSAGTVHHYGDRATGHGYGASTLARSRDTHREPSETVFRTAGFEPSSGGYDPSVSGSRSSGRGYGASNLGTTSKNKSPSSEERERSYASSSGMLNNLYLTSMLVDNAQEMRALRQEAALDRELAQLDRKRDYLQEHYHIEVPNYYEYEQNHPVRTPKTHWGAIALGALGGAALLGMMSGASGSGAYRVTTTLCGGMLGATMGSMFSERPVTVQKEHVEAYKEMLAQVERKAVEQPQTDVYDQQSHGRIVQPEQVRSV